MLSNLLEQLQGILKNCNVKLNDKQIKCLKQTLIYHKGGILPASVLKRELDIPYPEIHRLMSFLSTSRILMPIYKISCENNMNTGMEKVYRNIFEIPVEVCDRCEKECVILKNIIVEFEVCM